MSKKVPGANATRPLELPLLAWKAILKRVWSEFQSDQGSTLAAAIAYYMMISMVPLLVTLFSIYGLFGDPGELARTLANFDVGLPDAAKDFMRKQLLDLGDISPASLSIGVVVSILLSLYSASKAARNVITAVNAAYGEEESRSFLHLTGIALLLTLCGIMLLLVGVGALVAVPLWLEFFAPPSITTSLSPYLKWVVVLLAMTLGLAVLDRYGPNRTSPEWRWVTFGSFITSVLWVSLSLGFQLYVSNFGKYNETYGSLAGVILLLLWFYLSANIVILGAELNSEMELQTRKDTTVGPDRPLGERGAVKADNRP